MKLRQQQQQQLHHRTRATSVVALVIIVVFLSLLCMCILLPQPISAAPSSSSKSNAKSSSSTSTDSSSSTSAKSRPMPIAVDFGSEFIKVASVRPGAGNYHIVVDEQSKRKVPAVVAFEGGERHFGNGATQLTMRKPKETYWWAHRLLGQNVSSPQVDALRAQSYPYDFVAVPERPASVGYMHKDFDGSSTFVLSVEEVVAMSLEHVIKISVADAEAPISGGVITVPSHWTQAQRQAMLDAAEIADFNVFGLVNENTAAAIQYGVDRKYSVDPAPHTVMFINIGSTTMQVSIVTFEGRVVQEGRKNRTEGEMTVLASAALSDLGGQLFEARLTDWVVAKVQAELPAVDVRANARVMAKIRSAAEKAKLVLSANEDTLIVLPGLLQDRDFKYKISRAEFVELTSDLVARVRVPIAQALRDANLTAADLADALIVGGGTRVPAVQAAIKAELKRETLGQSLNGDEGMVMGAEFKSIEMSRVFRTRPFHVNDATLYPIDVHLRGEAGSSVTGSAGVEEEDASSSSSSTSFDKHVSLFRRFNRLSKKKTLTFTHDRDFSCELAYAEAASEFLAPGTPLSIATVNVTGFDVARNNTKYAKLMAEQKPRVKLVFLLDQDGMARLTSADLLIDEIVQSRVPKKKTATPAEAAANATTDADAANATTSAADAAGADAESEESASSSASSSNSADATPSTDAESTASSTDATANNATDASSANSTETAPIEYEMVEQKISHRVPLRISLPYAADGSNSLAPMTTAQKRAAKERLAAFRRADALKQEMAKAKNDLEGFIYGARSRLNEGEWDEVSNEEQRSELRALLEASEEWLYEQPETTLPSVFQAKLDEIRKLSEPIVLRFVQRTRLPSAIEESERVFNFTRQQVADYPKTRAWVPAADLERLANLTDSTEEWIKTQAVAQSSLAKHEVPVLTSEMIYEKLDPVRSLSYELFNLRKPAEPKPKTAKKAKGGKTAAGDDAKSSGSSTGADGGEAAAGAEDGTTADDASSASSNTEGQTADSTENAADSTNGGASPDSTSTGTSEESSASPSDAVHDEL